jgi:methyl-accepting chemotaxis protein
MQDIVAQSTQLETTFGKLTPITNEFDEVVSYQLNYTLRTGKREVQEMTASLNPLTNELRVQKGAVKEVATGWDKFVSGLKGKFSSIIQYLVSITSINDMIRYFKQGVQYVREIDSALTELKKVTNETDASYAKFLNTMSQTASEVGGTIANLTTMAAEWARLGYTMEEAGKLAQSTAILLNVSEFQDATTASEALISTMQAFQYTADESQHVVDILNEVKVTCLLMQ